MVQEGERVGFLNFTGSFQSFLHLIVLLADATFHLLILINDGLIIFITVLFLCSFSLIVVVAIGVTDIVVIIIIVVVVGC